MSALPIIQADLVREYDDEEAGRSFVAGALELSEASGRVTASGIPILLRPIEFRLLAFMMRTSGRVHTRAELLAHVWGRKKAYVGERTVDVHIRRIRSSLAPFGMDTWIGTIHTRGYRFSTQH